MNDEIVCDALVAIDRIRRETEHLRLNAATVGVVSDTQSREALERRAADIANMLTPILLAMDELERIAHRARRAERIASSVLQRRAQ